MLLPSDRLRPGDMEVWERLHRADVLRARGAQLRGKTDRAAAAIRSFVGKGHCYAGVSWGKDSTVLAHLIASMAQGGGGGIPLVWVVVHPIANPDCFAVRDAFLSMFGRLVDYHEIERECRYDAEGWHAGGSLESGFAEAAHRFGPKHISGVRGEESGVRKIRMCRFGESSIRTCAPIGWWSGADVFAYLERHDLPVHPAYAMSYAGTYERERIRVASISGQRGTGCGRHGWEQLYYPDVLRRVGEYQQQPMGE